MRSERKKNIGLVLMGIAIVVGFVLTICALMTLIDTFFVQHPAIGFGAILVVLTAGCGYGGWFLYAENKERP